MLRGSVNVETQTRNGGGMDTDEDEWVVSDNSSDLDTSRGDCVTITETITNKVHTIKFPPGKPRDLFQFALTHPNCVIRSKCKWRCTSYHPKFTVNMFRGNSWVLATREDDTRAVREQVEEAFGERPQDVVVENKTMIFRINASYNLDELFDYLNLTKGPNEGVQLLDKARYPAIICVVDKRRKTTLEIYHKGTVNATGMKTPRDVQDVRDYLKYRVAEFIKINQTLHF
jgi:hypothetical protein